jgi:hypothetical protein
LGLVAGTGFAAAAAGDNGSADLASFTFPVRVTSAALGAVYVADFNAAQVRKIT